MFNFFKRNNRVVPVNDSQHMNRPMDPIPSIRPRPEIQERTLSSKMKTFMQDNKDNSNSVKHRNHKILLEQSRLETANRRLYRKDRGGCFA